MTSSQFVVIIFMNVGGKQGFCFRPVERETAVSEMPLRTQVGLGLVRMGVTDIQTASRRLRNASDETCVLELTCYLRCVLLVGWYVVSLL